MSRPLVLLVSLLLTVGIHAQDPARDKVVQAMRTGNAAALSAQFIANIDLTIKETSEVYSRSQAEQIVRKFFNDHPPVDLVIEHSGVSKFGDEYFIGILRTRNGYFRVTFFLKKVGDAKLVKQLRIESSKNDL